MPATSPTGNAKSAAQLTQMPLLKPGSGSGRRPTHSLQSIAFSGYGCQRKVGRVQRQVRISSSTERVPISHLD